MHDLKHVYCFRLGGKLLLAGLHHLHVISTHAKLIAVPVHAGEEHFAVLLALWGHGLVIGKGLGLLHLGWGTLGGSSFGAASEHAHDHATSDMSL